jgi:arsenate reductase-like glutaredoxin family protein
MLIIGINLGVIILNIIAFIILMGFAFITLGRFLIISFLVGFLPLAVIALAIPGRAGYWQRWWKEFLKWCFNFPLLMLLTLIGFSLIAYGTGYFSEGTQGGLFLTTVQYSKIFGVGNIQDYGEALALILRFVFICGYYVLIMYLCISLGDAFGKFGVNAGQWIWLKIAGGVRWGARTAWRPAAERIGKRFESAAETFSRLASKPVIGGMFGGLKRLAESVGEKMTKPSKEAKESEAQNIFKKYEKENKEDILLKEVLEGQHKRLENELTKILTDKLSKEEIMNVFKDLDVTTLKGLQKRKKVFSMLNKKLGGLLTKETAEEISAAVADLNLSEIDWVSLRKWFGAVDKGKELEEAISILPELLSKEKKKRFAVNPTAWPLINANHDLLKDEDIVRGIQSNPAWRIYQKERDSGKNPEEISIDPKLLKGANPKEAKELLEKIISSKPPEPLKEKERVRLKGTNEEGVITWLSYKDNKAIIKLRDGSEEEVSLDQLERIS